MKAQVIVGSESAVVESPSGKSRVMILNWRQGMSDQGKRAVTLVVALCLAGTSLFAQMPQGGPPGGPPAAVDVSGIANKALGIAYASASATQTLDVYWPSTGKGPWPVIFSVHGGGFAFGDNRGAELASALNGLERGYAVVGVNYRMSGEAVFPAAIDDVMAAISYVRKYAAKWNLDTRRFAAWGSSAGGNLVALAGTKGSGDTALQAVVDQYGPIDFLAMDKQFAASGMKGQTHDSADSFESQYLGARISLVPDKVRAANPTTFLDAKDPPFLIQHGDADLNIPTQQSVDFAAALAATLGKDKVQLDIIKGAEHGGAQFETTANLKRIFDWLDAALAR